MGSSFSLVRSTVVQATAETVHGLLIDFKQWKLWSPWEQIDPAARTKVYGEPSGVGAQYSWRGNKRVGMGRMMVVSDEFSVVEVKQRLELPVPQKSLLTFRLFEVDEGLEVEWELSGEISSILAVMAGPEVIEGYMGPIFERGLEQLRAVAEELESDA